MWTLTGRYIGTLGSPVGWNKLSSSDVVDDNYNFRIPPDLKPKLSSTSLKILNGGKVEQAMTSKEDNTELKPKDETELNVYGVPLEEPILGKHFKLPPRSRHYENPILDKSLPYVSLFHSVCILQLTLLILFFTFVYRFQYIVI